jgi:hypothetical protein
MAMVELIWDKDRSGTATAPTGASITVGERSDFSPDDLLAAAAAGGLMETFLGRAAGADVSILSYASAAHVTPTGPGHESHVVIRCYVVTTEGGSPADVERLLRASLHESPVGRMLGDAVTCQADIRCLCGACAR